MTVDGDQQPRLPGTDQAFLGDLFWEVAGYIELMGEAALADLPISTASSGMLTVVLAEPGITVTEIARRFAKSQQTISQMMARLVKLELIERRVGRGRSVELFLTPEGRAVAERALVQERLVDDQVREKLGAERYESARELLNELRQRLRTTR